MFLSFRPAPYIARVPRTVKAFRCAPVGHRPMHFRHRSTRAAWPEGQVHATLRPPRVPTRTRNVRVASLTRSPTLNRFRPPAEVSQPTLACARVSTPDHWGIVQWQDTRL